MLTHAPMKTGAGRAPSAARTRVSPHPARSAAAPPIVCDVLRSEGQPLTPEVRRLFEPVFRYDFGNVRVHADDAAAESARAIGARAYTAGPKIVFGAQQYRPAEAQGRRLIAHELAHVVQQGARLDDAGSLRVGDPSDVLERHAEEWAAATSLGTGRPSPAPAGGAPVAGLIQRFPLVPIGVDTLPPILAAQKIAQGAQQQAYAQAVAQLQSIDPVLHGYLSKTTLGGGPTTIRTAKGVDNSQNPPVTIQYLFTLDVKNASLAPGTDADFKEGSRNLSGSGTSRNFTASMSIEVSPTASVSLAQSLYHEGLHMLIYMERFLPTSPHGAAAANYQKIAQAQPEYGPLSAEVEVFIDLDLKNRALKDPTLTPAPGAAKRDADQLLQDLWEEKYIHDQEKAKFNAPTGNSALALTYTVKDLGDFGVRAVPSDKNLQSIVQKVTKIYTAIDQQNQTAAPPQSPVANPAQKTP